MSNDGHKGKTLDPIKHIFLNHKFYSETFMYCSEKEEKKWLTRKDIQYMLEIKSTEFDLFVWCTNLIMILSFCSFSYVYVHVLCMRGKFGWKRVVYHLILHEKVEPVNIM